MKLSRKSQVIMGISLILILVFVIGGIVLKNNIDRDKGLKEIDKAIEESNVDYLKDRVEMVDGERLPEENLKDILRILKESGQVLKTEDLNSIEDKPDDLDFDIPSVYLKKDGREKIFFNKYKLVFDYYDLFIDNNLKKGAKEVYIDNRKMDIDILEDGNIVCKKLLPGSYEYKLLFGEELKKDFKNKIDVFNKTGYKTEYKLDSKTVKSNIIVEEDVFIEIRNVSIHSSNPLEDGKVFLFLNGEKTDEIINKRAAVLNNVYNDEELVVQGQMKVDGKVYKSRTVDLGSSKEEYVDLTIDYKPPYEPSAFEFENLMSEYMYSIVDAINSGDFNIVKGTLTSGGPLYKKQKKLVTDLSDKGVTEDLIEFTFLGDPKKVANNKYEMLVKETHRIYYPDKESKEVVNTWRYTLKLDGEHLSIYDLVKK